MSALRRTLPNAITLARLVLALAFFWVAGSLDTGDAADPTRAWVAVWMFVVAALSDILDGYLARRWQVVTTFGRILDPVVDKVLVIGGLILLCAAPLAPASHVVPWMVILVVTRELLVTSVRAVLEAQGISFAADRFGKFKMFVQCVAVPFCLGAAAIPNLRQSSAFMQSTDALVWLMVAVTAGSVLPYLLRAAVILRSNVVGRAA
ncbi:MAG: CDP-diacylglycerol--glycerol-3-phosphate 3-phosphatidyltransferase [Planctomycetes bacterium]|nr:CDP-diacylglycerol--glycerol-3-phosphate 3-phosphatidyltransferase [Planctomycetota bacterium]